MSKSASAEHKWHVFAILLAATTFSPLLFFPISTQFHGDAMGLAVIAAVLTFLGGSFHVASTGFFYADAETRTFFRQHRLRYYFVPLLLVICTGVAFSLAGTMVSATLLFLYFVWQTYHYQKQNYGILSFVAAATDRIPPSRLERAILQLSVWIGIVGLIKPYNLARHTPLEHYAALLHQGAAYAFWIIPVLLLVALATSSTLRRNPFRTVCLTVGGFFYLPTFLFSNPVAAISGYAIAHGLQYLVFMYFVGVAKPSRAVRVALLAAIALVVGAVLALTGGLTPFGRPSQFIFGCYLGLVMSHFVIDAGIWRMREPFQRAYMGKAFDFVFARGRRLAERAAAPTRSEPQAAPSGVAAA